MPHRATQDVWVMVESSDKTWSTGEGNGKSLQYSCLENPTNSMKRQKDRTLKDELHRSVGAQYATGDQWRITPERMKRWSQSKNNTPLHLVTANTLFQQHKRRLYTWNSPDGQYRNQINYILCSQRWRSSIQSAKTRPEADCGSDHKLLIAKFRLKLTG